ncbi:exodeoxyribonuclease V subunit gamma [Pelagibaculum spongiae]|uniref:RecBCD enzyme subunit RecC n=1 Tax=Pelagibaculum spongiae TaxID=2080658 RepID=A0A2V1H018_9GAMM|nr:exodeoxyribonuclease V subunit gamma [Pelagibaculum spongiae]PVZ68353.1 exodeoxyribonuclease V subunit gamma [Pelagibaculum spongiae]
MLHLYQSNRLEHMFQQLCQILETPLKDPMAAEQFVVQSQGMARWLSQSLAERFGIQANAKYPFPSALIWQLFNAMKPLPETSPFALDALVWSVMGQLQPLLADAEQADNQPTIAADSVLAPLAQYLDGDEPQLRLFQLSDKIADTYDQYLVYRPDWISLWEAGENPLEQMEDQAAHWQPQLWRQITEQLGTDHRTGLLLEWLETATPEMVKEAGVPERIILFGIPAMPVSHFMAFVKLADLIDVHCFLLNPCEKFWDDLVSDRRAASINLKNAAKLLLRDDDLLHLDQSHPLLASWGRMGQDFQRLLNHQQMDPQGEFFDNHDVADSNQPVSLLSAIQQSILDLQCPGRDKNPVNTWQQNDRSIVFHSAHSPLREVEVLHDQLLKLFDSEPDLQPADVLVMMPDIESYAPLIEAVFNSPESWQQRIPSSVADRRQAAMSPLIQAFNGLLGLAGGRFGAVEVLDLLEYRPLAEKFGIEEDQLPKLRHWVDKAGIRWGRDAAHLQSLNMDGEARHTWRNGLDRLILGYAMPPNSSQDAFSAGCELFNSEQPGELPIAPIDAAEGESAQLLARLCLFIDQLFERLQQLEGSFNSSQWREKLSALVANFISPDQDQAASYQFLLNGIQRLEHTTTAAGYDKPLSLEVVRIWLDRALSQAIQPGNFLTGQVTFCQLVPMRAIPFKVICLLGMDETAFPRQDRRAGFDLIRHQGRQGDRSQRDEDRYLFLEALLSARQQLYVSYVGQGIRDNQYRPPSILVSELQDLIEQGWQDQNGQPLLQQLIDNHPLQPFSPRYFSETDSNTAETATMSSAQSYSAQARELAGILGQQQLWPGLGKASSLLPEKSLEESADKSAAETSQLIAINVTQLVEFFCNPVRGLLKNRYGLYLDERFNLPEDRESFDLAGKERYQLLDDAIKRRLTGDSQDSFSLYQAQGELPGDSFAQLHHQKLTVDVDALLEHLPADINKPVDDQAIDLILDIDTSALSQLLPSANSQLNSIDRFQISGRIDHLYSCGRVLWRPTRKTGINLRDRICLWLPHLLLCAADSNSEVEAPVVAKNSQFVCIDHQIELPKIEADTAKQILQQWLNFWLIGQQQPLPFARRTVEVYLDKRLAKRKPLEHQPAVNAAIGDWLDGRRTLWGKDPAEKDDPWMLAAFGQTDQTNHPFQSDLFEQLAEQLLLPMMEATDPQ